MIWVLQFSPISSKPPPTFRKVKAREIRQSFLDFFAQKKHEIVTSASLLPESPNLLFTNAGMNQFVPYFLGDQKAPFTRAADTQKCIRAGGKHNDLEDVGLDTYHHTFFEMLGNWSFGDYFKKDAIEWAWELLVDVWMFPPQRLYATVYEPKDGDPAEFDEEAHSIWSAIFKSAGLDPSVHVVSGGKKDNFWMMGETGPCGPCSELHLDLTPNGDSKGKLVNQDSHLCIEIWNLVFIQFNADKDGTFSPLKAKHVDTGMGFERVTSVIQSTKNFTDFSTPASNYDTDIFSPIFEKLEELSGKSYQSTLPFEGKPQSEEEEIDIAFRVIADHLRALVFSIADGILPGNNDRNYVLRRILRRAVKYGRTLGFSDPFFYKLSPVLIDQMGETFPELKTREELIQKTLRAEEESFNKTLDRGIELFTRETETIEKGSELSGVFAFKLYDTYGFPLDLTELMARECGITINHAEFEAEMEQQKKRAREAHKSIDIIVSEDEHAADSTQFCGFEHSNLLNFTATCTDLVSSNDQTFLVVDQSPLYAEMGGQVGDSGIIKFEQESFKISNVIKDSQGRFLHQIESSSAPNHMIGNSITLNVDIPRRLAIQRHHTATHILHWALREVLGDHVRQAGSLVEDDRLRFDFSHYEGVSHEQLQTIERVANEKLLQNDKVETYEIPFSEKPDGVIAFFGDKYGEFVRVVDLGGWSQELCGGTHVRSTGEVGSIRILSESAISAGTRRLEAVAGISAYEWVSNRVNDYHQVSQKLGCQPNELLQRVEQLSNKSKELEKQLRSIEQKSQAGIADSLIESAKVVDGIRIIHGFVPNLNPNDLRGLSAQINKRSEPSVVLLASEQGKKSSMVCICSPAAIEAGHKAGAYISELAEKIGGKGGGKADFAMGGGPAGTGLQQSISALSLNS
jgi:alanyl-tRNA synthetase